MGACFATIVEDIRHKRSLISLPSLVGPDVMKQSKITDYEIEIVKNLALEKLHRQRNPKEFFALDLLEKQFSH